MPPYATVWWMLILVVGQESADDQLRQAHAALARAGVKGAESARILRSSAAVYQKSNPVRVLTATMAAAALDDARAVEAHDSQALQSAIAGYHAVATKSMDRDERRAACMRLGELFYFFQQHGKAMAYLESWLYGTDPTSPPRPAATASPKGVLPLPHAPADPDALTALAAILMDPRSSNKHKNNADIDNGNDGDDGESKGALRHPWVRAAELLTEAVATHPTHGPALLRLGRLRARPPPAVAHVGHQGEAVRLLKGAGAAM